MIADLMRDAAARARKDAETARGYVPQLEAKLAEARRERDAPSLSGNAAAQHQRRDAVRRVRAAKERIEEAKKVGAKRERELRIADLERQAVVYDRLAEMFDRGHAGPFLEEEHDALEAARIWLVQDAGLAESTRMLNVMIGHSPDKPWLRETLLRREHGRDGAKAIAEALARSPSE